MTGRRRLQVDRNARLVAAIWPQAWLGLFGDDPTMLATGTVYLQIVGRPMASSGLACRSILRRRAGRFTLALTAGLLRMLVAVGGGWTALYLTGSLGWVFAALAFGLMVYG